MTSGYFWSIDYLNILISQSFRRRSAVYLVRNKLTLFFESTASSKRVANNNSRRHEIVILICSVAVNGDRA